MTPPKFVLARLIELLTHTKPFGFSSREGILPMRRLIVALALTGLCSCAPYAPAQNAVAPVQNRVLGPIDDAERVTLKGNVHPLAQKQFDQGAAPGSDPTGRMMLLLQRSAAQQRALDPISE